MTKLTRGTKRIIEVAIESLPEEHRQDRYKICEAVADIAENRYAGEGLEYQLERMGISTTKVILEKIDIFLKEEAMRLAAEEAMRAPEQ